MCIPAGLHMNACPSLRMVTALAAILVAIGCMTSGVHAQVRADPWRRLAPHRLEGHFVNLYFNTFTCLYMCATIYKFLCKEEGIKC